MTDGHARRRPQTEADTQGGDRRGERRAVAEQSRGGVRRSANRAEHRAKEHNRAEEQSRLQQSRLQQSRGEERAAGRGSNSAGCPACQALISDRDAHRCGNHGSCGACTRCRACRRRRRRGAVPAAQRSCVRLRGACSRSRSGRSGNSNGNSLQRSRGRSAARWLGVRPRMVSDQRVAATPAAAFCAVFGRRLVACLLLTNDSALPATCLPRSTAQPS